MSKKITLYFDMDGVLADFNAKTNAVDRFKTEKGFFKELAPIKENLEGLIQLYEMGYMIKILSTSPHEQADKDKRAWLKKYVSVLPRNRFIFGRPNVPKIDYLTPRQRKNAVLIDDYGKNVREWVEGGGLHAIKITPTPKDVEIDYQNVLQVVEVLKAL